jgi:hypothetical protein
MKAPGPDKGSAQKGPKVKVRMPGKSQKVKVSRKETGTPVEEVARQRESDGPRRARGGREAIAPVFERAGAKDVHREMGKIGLAWEHKFNIVEARESTARPSVLHILLISP